MRRLWITVAATLTIMPRLSAADALKPLDFEVRVRASVCDAWDAWTTDAGVEKWFAPKANIELKAGGSYEILFLPTAPAGQRGAEGLKVLNYLPHEMLTVEWNAPPQLPRARALRSWLVVRFTDLGDGTVRVRLTQEGFAELAARHPEAKEELEKARAYFAKAWPQVLDKMRSHFDKSASAGNGPQITEAIVDAPLADVWTAFTTKKGLESWNVAHCEIDFKVGGRMLSHYDPKGAIGDPNTIENVILAYEPQHMFAMQIGKPPEKFPFKEAAKSVWHVIALEDAGAGRTRVRVTGLGFGSDEDSKKMRGFFEQGNAMTLKKLQEYFRTKGPTQASERGG